MKTYLFASSRDASLTYKTTVHDNGAVTCDCPARVECWHAKRVKAYPPVGRSPDVPVSRDDCREIMKLLGEGNEAGAHEAARALFPAMSEEETDDLLQEILDTTPEDSYDSLAGGDSSVSD